VEAPRDSWATFAYETPAPTYRLRIAVEELSMGAMAFIGYTIQNPPPAYPGVPATPLWRKLTFAPGSWYWDDDELSTNFVGHPSAGTFYYMFARANRVSIPEAFLWTIGTSLLWELIEYKEPVSYNDMIMTPVGGLAIGEGFTQLSGYFDRSGSDSLSKALAVIFDPMKKIHDWLDGVVPDRNPATRGWHEFDASAALGFLSQGGATYAAVQVAWSSRIFHGPGYGEPGSGSFGFADGNASSMGIAFTVAAGQTVDFLYETETALAGYYVRSIRRTGEDLDGWDLFVGGTVGYEFGSHVWGLSQAPRKNQICLVRVPGIDLRGRLFAGPFRIVGGVDVAFDFGGVEPFEAPGSPPPGTAYPTVYIGQGYYYGLGLHLAPLLEFQWKSLSLGGAARVDRFFATISGPYAPAPPLPVPSMQDSRTLASTWLRMRSSELGVEGALRAEWRDRWGSVGGDRASAEERALFASFAVVF